MPAKRDFLGGKLLIATPNMGDPRFERTVVLMCTHDERHAMGVIVNKRMKNVDIADLLDHSQIERDSEHFDTPVYFGGPVSPEKGLVIHTLDYRTEGTIQISENLGVTVSKTILEDIFSLKSTQDMRAADGIMMDQTNRVFHSGSDDRSALEGPSQHRLIAGHAGWGAGQLEAEISANAWAHCDANEDLIFADEPKSVWQKAFGQLGVTEAMFSTEWSSNRAGNTPLH